MKPKRIFGSPIQKLPSSGEERDALRKKGQFWTPGWLAELMSGWCMQAKPSELFDPAVGPGTFFLAARRLGYKPKFSGYDIDQKVVRQAIEWGLSETELKGIKIHDFLSSETEVLHQAIVANPPYIRHHFLDENRKGFLKSVSLEHLGIELDGRTGLHVYFLIKSLSLLSPNGRLAFLLPADVCESVSSRRLWEAIFSKYNVQRVLNFSTSANPFPGVDTNALVFLIKNDGPTHEIEWVNVTKHDSSWLRGVMVNDHSVGRPGEKEGAQLHVRATSEALDSGLSRPPGLPVKGVPIRELVKVVRGIATGDNDFFFLTSSQVKETGISSKYFARAIGRTRDCQQDTLTKEILAQLDLKGRPTYLLSITDDFAQASQDSLSMYIAKGESQGLNSKPLLKTRKPWYKAEHRDVPPILFAYLGRRSSRFILNQAGARPLSGFLCVYPLEKYKSKSLNIWKALNDPETIKALYRVGKSYGDGALKVEPRQLDSAIIPSSVLKKYGLD